MRQDHRVNRFGIDGKRRPVAFPEHLQPLKHTAINQQAPSVEFKQVFGARYRSRAAQAGQSQCHHNSFPPKSGVLE